MAAVVTVRVYRPDLSDARDDVLAQLQAAVDTEMNRLRARYFHQATPAIEVALADALRRVTAGKVAEEDLPLAAAAVHRGDYLTINLTTNSCA